MTLAELRRLATAYSGRTDPEFLANVDDFIRLGHRYVERQWYAREQHFLHWEHQGGLAIGQYSVPLPAQYRQSAHLVMQTGSVDPPSGWTADLERVPIIAMMHDVPWRLSDGTVIDLFHIGPGTYGEPRVFGVYGRTVHVRPAPAAAKRVWISGNAWAMPLTYDSDETVLSQSAPEAVLYAALREAWGFLGDPGQKATWEAEAARAIEAWMRDGTQEEIAAAQGGFPLVMQVPG
jgi:hypothetical protein